jgi:N-acylneuraminate cytidylyltransferase
MNNIAIITARGGSKRIPNKNIRSFFGRPIVAYPISAAIESTVFTTVMVSTEDDTIVEIAKAHGAEVPFMRSTQTANDFATTADVINEVLDEYKKLGQLFDNVCILYPTAVFASADKIRKTLTILEDSDADALTPMVEYQYPPQRGFTIKDGYAKMLHPELYRTRTQDMEKIYHDIGQFYWAKYPAIVEQRNLLFEKTIVYVVSETEHQDIDTLENWKMAELKYKLFLQEHSII